jgi:hypothetical protein
MFGCRASEKGKRSLPIKVRHPIEAPEPFRNPNWPARTYFTFAATLSPTVKQAKGRRIFLVVGERGAGKGHFFALLQRDELLDDFFKRCGQTSRDYGTILFCNLTYSAEIASVWDGIIDSILILVGKRPREAIRLARCDKLAYALKLLKEQKSGRRVLIALNSTDILFDADGFPKTAQIRRIFETLISDEFHKNSGLFSRKGNRNTAVTSATRGRH